MINIYKSGGPWKKGDKEYTVKTINYNDSAIYIAKGWVLSLDDVKAKRKTKAKVNKDDNKE